MRLIATLVCLCVNARACECLCLRSYRAVLDSDAPEYCGHSRVDHRCHFSSTESPWNDRPCSMLVYAPCRTVVVYAHKDFADGFLSKALKPMSERKAAVSP